MIHELKPATEQSVQQNEIVHVAIAGIDATLPFMETAIGELRSIAEDSGLEFDWVCNGNTTECWAYEEASEGNGDMAWRVHLDCESNDE